MDDPRSPLDDKRWHDALRAHAGTPASDDAWARITTSTPRSSRRRPGARLAVAAIAAAFVIAGTLAFAARRSDSPEQLRVTDRLTSTTTIPALPRLHVTTTVLEDQTHGPELCLGGVRTSYPPQCGNVPVSNWDWSAVNNEERANGSIWGDYEVVGTYDGTQFTLTQPPGAPQHVPPDDTTAPKTPCPPPSGGWRVNDPGRVSEADQQALTDAAHTQPDFVEIWIDDQHARPGHPQDRSKAIWNVAFTGDLDRHEQELRAIWGGALCVSRLAHSSADLQRIQTELLADKSIKHLWSSAGNSENRVQLAVPFDDGTLQHRLDEKYGIGIVRVISVLQPAP